MFDLTAKLLITATPKRRRCVRAATTLACGVGLIFLFAFIFDHPAPHVRAEATTQAAPQRKPLTEIVSLRDDDAQSSGYTDGESAISHDNRFIAFTSHASDLVAGDTNFSADVFVRDRLNNSTERVSVTSSEAQTINPSSFDPENAEPAISADGRFVAFSSNATNFTSEATNGTYNIYVRDRQEGTTERISVATDGAAGNRNSTKPAITPDARFVVFESEADNLVSGDTNGFRDIFLHDRMTRTSVRVSVAADGTQANSLSSAPSVSADGNVIAFSSYASDLVSGDTNFRDDIFVRDRAAGTTERVSVTRSGEQANGSSFTLKTGLSADGRHVFFDSAASDFIPDDGNGFTDVFAYDRVTRRSKRISVSSVGTEGDSASSFDSVTPDGRFITFFSRATNLVAGDANKAGDVFLHDCLLRTTRRISIADDGAGGDAVSADSAISADGSAIAFWSRAANLSPDDLNGTDDVLLKTTGQPNSILRFDAARSATRLDADGLATFAGTEIATADDPAGDSAAAAAAAVGSEITQARLFYRSAIGDVLAHLELSSLPVRATPPAPGESPLVYTFELRTAGVRYEARLSARPTGEPAAALFRCEATCVQTASLRGSVGGTGEEILISVPLALINASEEATLTGTRILSASGSAESGAVFVLDEVSLADVTIPKRGVALGIARAGTLAGAVNYSIPTLLAADNSFVGSTDISALAPGAYELFARACLKAECATTRTPFTVPVRIRELQLALNSSIAQTINACVPQRVGRVVLDAPASAGGALVTLENSNSAATFPASVVVPAGKTSQTFNYTVRPVAATRSGEIVARTQGGDAARQTLIVRPIWVRSLMVARNPVQGGQSVAATVTLECGAAPNQITVGVGSNVPAVAITETYSITFMPGERQKTFTVTTRAGAGNRFTNITATTTGGASKLVRLYVAP